MTWPLPGKRIVVTGGAGFIGSFLCERLLRDGANVIAIDNYYTGLHANISHLQFEDRFKILTHDIITPIDLECEAIFNLACPASPVQYQKNPVQTMKTNVLGSINVLELAMRNGARIVQASTSEIYGDPQIHPQHEEYWGHVNPLGPRACYDEGKRSAETMFLDYRRQYSVTTKIARIFNTYGPRMQPHDGRVVSTFIVNALADKPIPLFGDGRQTRSFCYVTDIVDGLVKLMQSDASVAGPINLGNPEEISITELANNIISIAASKSEIIHLPLPPDDPKRRKPDISKAASVLGWHPTTPRSRGLRETILHFQQTLLART